MSAAEKSSKPYGYTFARNLPSLRDWTLFFLFSRHFVPGYPRFNPSGIKCVRATPRRCDKLALMTMIPKLLRLILWIIIGALFLGGGCVACALLWKETDTTKAVLLAVAALIGGAGCLYSVFRSLRVISPTAKGPFILTLH